VYKALEYRKMLNAEKSMNEKQTERYVFLNELAKATNDPKQLRDELLNILLAGRDTTASLLSHTWHALARRPDVWAKLKAEVDALDGKAPDYETLRNMRYLKYVLNECKLFPQPLLSLFVLIHQ
jgi:cytochrome P450